MDKNKMSTMSTTKKCLKTVLEQLILTQYKLHRISEKYRGINYNDILTNDEHSNIENKKIAINDILNGSCNEIKTTLYQEQTSQQVTQNNPLEQCKYINKLVLAMTDDQCSTILSTIKNKLKSTLNEQKQTTEQEQNWSYDRNDHDGNVAMDPAIMRKSLKINTLDDKWYFTFIAKIVTLIQNTLGVKTPEETMLEKSIKDIENIENTKSNCNGP